MAMHEDAMQMSTGARLGKRLLDIVVAVVGLLLTWWIIIIVAVIARMDTGNSGFFVQSRIGRHGKPFKLYKIRTMKTSETPQSTVTTILDQRVTRSGRIFRRTKLDELPQLFNVLIGDMSLVGPRPDVAGFADTLTGEARAILSLRPGITGPATLRYRNEEVLLATVADPEAYNRDVIFPDKVRINMDYIRNYSLCGDIKYLVRTIFC